MRYLILKENEPPLYTDNFEELEFIEGSKMAFFDLFHQIYTIDGERWEIVQTEKPKKGQKNAKMVKKA